MFRVHIQPLLNTNTIFNYRVVPWDPANNDIITASMIQDGDEPAFRDVKQDFVIRPGHLGPNHLLL